MNPILEEFKELVEIPSPTGDERKMADRLKQKLREIGCEVLEDDAGKALGGTAGNVIARLKGEGGRPVLLSAHMARVPNGDGIICRV
ncbi:MAG: peptidase M20, partial [Lachnospiraceae bacterium]|nr:peptidase M20 [Lachnospiraceae bacterium]